MKPLLKPEGADRLKKLSPEDRQYVIQKLAEKIAAKKPLPTKGS